MPTSKYKTRIRYAPKFRQQIVDLVRAGCPIPELVQQFGCTAATVRNWLKLAQRQESKPVSAGLTSNERAELEALRRENRQLLMAAASWFAAQNPRSSKRSSES